TACHSHLYAFIQDILQPEPTKPHNRSRSMPEEAVNSTASVLENSRIVVLDVLGCLPQPDLLSVWSPSPSELMARSNMN
ncbi:MAG: hypothetical protein P8P54_12505, partial [Pseudomonadales bacterium]|nr:hypothetical protein [Pseudomonadales bacterium]